MDRSHRICASCNDPIEPTTDGIVPEVNTDLPV
ncbi:MAG: alpha/beta hydrolase, partial [Cutibacterium acnes]|nr:alpha/beta hydrolase [Cutibacterium acnes]